MSFKSAFLNTASHTRSYIAGAIGFSSAFATSMMLSEKSPLSYSDTTDSENTASLIMVGAATLVFAKAVTTAIDQGKSFKGWTASAGALSVVLGLAAAVHLNQDNLYVDRNVKLFHLGAEEYHDPACANTRTYVREYCEPGAPRAPKL